MKGSDENSGSKEDPIKTLQRALEMVEPGWYIKLGGGIYEQNAQTVTPGTPEAPIVIEPDGDSEPVLDGGLRLHAPLILHSFYVLRGVEIRNYDQGVELRGVEGVVLEENYIHHINGECVRLWRFAIKNVVMENNIHDCGLKRNGEGIYIGTDLDQREKLDGLMDESVGNFIEGNEIYNVDEGIDVKPGSSNTTITNNEIYSAINPGSGGINVRSGVNYISNNLSYNNNGAGFRIGQNIGGVNNVLRGNIALNNDFAGYKFINSPQNGDCTNIGVGKEPKRLYYFAEGLDKFLLCDVEMFSIDQPWEAEAGEVLAPLEIADDPSASSGKYLLQVDENGGGYALYRVVIPWDGKYQLKATIKGEEGSSNSARVSIDGNDPILWPLGDLNSDWTWVFGPNIQLSAGLHELKIHLDGTTLYIDKVEVKSR